MPSMLGDTAAPRIELAQLPPEAAALITRLQQQVQAQAREIAWRDAKLKKVNFELARLKRWKFGAKTEAMTAEQRALFQDTMAEEKASLQAQLAELQAGLPEVPKTPKAPRAKPRRHALPEHLERVEHRHEPEDTTCPTPECGQPMQRIGEDGNARRACRLASTGADRQGLRGPRRDEAVAGQCRVLQCLLQGLARRLVGMCGVTGPCQLLPQALSATRTSRPASRRRARALCVRRFTAAELPRSRH